MGQELRAGHQGTGPGEFTPDGCAVELYGRLPVGTEPDVIAAAVPAGARILELGSGAGRVTHPLIARGFDVTAVDESAAMLARWTQTFLSRPLTTEDFEQALRDADLALDAYLTPDRVWVRAVPGDVLPSIP
ncbi:methyltransferase domain-containing protein [Actinacidiphila alni]|nr:methyltransferase domain-containing protein [Actinacidiphila alni]